MNDLPGARGGDAQDILKLTKQLTNITKKSFKVILADKNSICRHVTTNKCTKFHLLDRLTRLEDEERHNKCSINNK